MLIYTGEPLPDRQSLWEDQPIFKTVQKDKSMELLRDKR